MQVDHAHDHRAPRIEGKVLETPCRVEAAHTVIERMGDNARAADMFGCAQSRAKHIRHEIRGVALPLMVFVDGKLAEQKCRHGIRAVALLRLRKKGALDLRGAQGDVADNSARRRVGENAHARHVVGLIDPGMPVKPAVDRLPTTIKEAAVVTLGERTRRVRHPQVQRSQDGTRLASLASAGIGSASRLIQPSNASQSFAGMVTTLRLSTSISAASTDLRRMKSLSVVRDCSAAASRMARSSGVTRTLRTDVV